MFQDSWRRVPPREKVLVRTKRSDEMKSHPGVIQRSLLTRDVKGVALEYSRTVAHHMQTMSKPGRYKGFLPESPRIVVTAYTPRHEYQEDVPASPGAAPLSTLFFWLQRSQGQARLGCDLGRVNARARVGSGRVDGSGLVLALVDPTRKPAG
jgi:hypothetical protein